MHARYTLNSARYGNRVASIRWAMTVLSSRAPERRLVSTRNAAELSLTQLSRADLSQCAADGCRDFQASEIDVAFDAEHQAEQNLGVILVVPLAGETYVEQWSCQERPTAARRKAEHTLERKCEHARVDQVAVHRGEADAAPWPKRDRVREAQRVTDARREQDS